MKKINEYIMLAEKKVGYVGDMEYVTFSKRDEPAGKFEILAFEQAAEPRFLYSVWECEGEKTPKGVVFGYFLIRLFDTKFYNNKIIKFEIQAYAKKEGDTNPRLYIETKNKDTGKYLKAYQFPILNW